MTPLIITPAAAEPITLAEVKSDRVIDTDETAFDEELQFLIKAAVGYAEKEQQLNRSLINKTYQEQLECFPDVLWYLKTGGAHTISSITYLDKDGAQQTLPEADYDYISDGELIKIKPVTSWPETKESFNAVTVTYIAGYGAAAEHVPSIIKKAMLLIIGTWYEHKENHSTGVELKQVPFAAENIFKMHKVQPKR